MVNKICANDREKSCVVIRSINNKNVVFNALIDTDRPVNLIKQSVYRKYYGDRDLFRVKKNTQLKGVNDSVITVCGKVYEQV